MPKRKFFILLFLTLLIWNSGFEFTDASFLTNGNYWILGIYIFGLVWLMWYLDKRVFNFLQKKIKINIQKIRTLIPYYIISYIVSVIVFFSGFHLLFSLPAPADEDTAFTLTITSILFTAFVLTSFFLYSKIKNELAEKPKEIIRETIIEKPAPKAQNFQLRRGNTNFQILIEDIAYFSLNNSMVYLTKMDGNSFPVLDTLSQIKNQSENGTLFPANRQFLITKKAVKSWKRTDTRKLVLELMPPVSEVVTVSKNKAPEFIQWMGK